MSNTLATSSGTITLPEDILWPDEHSWSPVNQVISTTLGGALVIEMANQLKGRPITLQGYEDGPWMTGAEVQALRDASIAQGDTPMTLTLSDGRTFQVLFYGGGNAPAVSATQVLLRSPLNSGEVSSFQWVPTIKLIEVA